MSQVVVDGATAALIRNGRQLEAPHSPGPWAMVDEAGALLAVYEAGDLTWAKPAVVLAEAVA
jgi:hypothetical protein